MRFLFLLFIAIPIVEMLLLFEVASHIGALVTVGLVVLTAVIGVQILKRQGWATFRRANDRLRAGELPAQEVLEGLCLAVGGALLLTPGFITDTIGFILLIGPSRRALIRALLRSGRLQIYSAGPDMSGFHFTNRPERRDGHDVYEGEFTREKPPESRLRDRD